MTTLQLLVSSQPRQASVFINLRQKDGGHYLYSAIVETGLERCILHLDTPRLTGYLDFIT
jgi:hypothetical protein